MKYVFGLSSLLVFSLGCTDKEGDTSTEEASTEEASSEEAFAPAEGLWNSGEMTISNDSCGIFDGEEEEGQDEEENAPVTLTMVDATTFTISDADMSISCTLSGMDFTCDPMTEENDFSGDGMVAVLTMSMTPTGTFTSTTAGDLTNQISYTCEGDDCAGFGINFPCEASNKQSTQFLFGRLLEHEVYYLHNYIIILNISSFKS